MSDEPTAPLWDEYEAAAIDAIMLGDIREAVPWLLSLESTAGKMLALLADSNRLEIRLSASDKAEHEQWQIGLFVYQQEQISRRETGRPNTESAATEAATRFKVSRAKVFRAKQTFVKWVSRQTKS